MAGDLAALLEHFDVHDAVLRLRGLVLFATWAGRILDGASMFGTRP
jgi:non-heme chloroperoxidase